MLSAGKRQMDLLNICLNKKNNDLFFLRKWSDSGRKPADGLRALKLITLEDTSSPAQSKIEQDKVTRLGANGLCSVTQTGMLMPDTSACCQTVLFRQSVQSQMAPSNNQTSSSYRPIFCISSYKPTVQAIKCGSGLWYSQTNQNEK